MLEQILEKDYIEQRHYLVFTIGLFYVVISYFVGMIFFPFEISVAILFLSTLLLLPTLMRLIEKEELVEAKQGLKHFYDNHKNIFEIYMFLFLGIFIGYIMLGIYDGTIFTFQNNYLTSSQGLSAQMINNFKMSDAAPSFQHFLAILSNNVSVMVIAFILSMFYGAGAIFLIIFNASIFSTFIVFIFQKISAQFTQALKIFGLFSIHMLPEMSGFLLAAIAGGVVSKAFIHEKFGSDAFRNVLKDCVAMLIIAFLIIALAAFLEVYFTGQVVKMFL